MRKLSNILLPTIVGITVYISINKFFPEKVSDRNSQKDLRGGDIIRNHLINKIMHDRALKIALISVFATVGFQYFNHEIQTLLLDDVFKQICVKEVDGQLKIVCDIIKEDELNFHTKSITELIVTSNLSKDDKINLLKLKLDLIINGECASTKRFLVISMIAVCITICVSGVGGLILFLEALYRLFQEGKISLALYKKILKIVTNRWTKLPVEHLL